MNKKCELLVPVGGTKQLIAAVENGADAVYLGGMLFNARAKADNFNEETMTEAIRFAHLRGVKVYVTMNTLLEDSQLVRALEYATFLYKKGVDALIVQDFGFGQLLRKLLPELELHLSTQASVYDLDGVLMAEKLGYTRVVMARELSLSEIRAITDSCEAEIEVFVHGALCFCYSGQCHLSRNFGGRSGNKGACAQPCRLAYKGDDGEESYKLSPKDLSMIDCVENLVDAGVASLKIEGRMKSPEYVATVTRIYRKYLDYVYARRFNQNEKPKEDIKVSEEDKLELAQAFNRGGFTAGYAFGDPKQSLMADKVSKHQGIYIGSVCDDTENGSSKNKGKRHLKVQSHKAHQYTCLVKLAGKQSLSQGDVVEIYSEKTGKVQSFMVTLANSKGNNILEIGDIKNTVYPGDKVNRIISGQLNKKAQESFENKDFHLGKFIRKSTIDMKLSFDGVDRLVLEGVVVADERQILSVKSDSFAASDEIAKEGKLEKLIANLRKMGGTAFEAGGIQLSDNLPANIPLSMINQLRRDLLEKLEISIINELENERKEVFSYRMAQISSFIAAQKEVITAESKYAKNSAFLTKRENNFIQQIYFYTLEDFEKFTNLKVAIDKCKEVESSFIAILPLAELVSFDRYSFSKLIDLAKEKGFEKIIPYVTHISKGKEDKIILEKWERAKEICNEYGIFVGNLTWLYKALAEGFRTYGDFGLNIYNKQAEALMEELGLCDWICSSETFTDENGAYPLMISEHNLDDNFIVDRKGTKLRIINRCFSDQMILTKNMGNQLLLQQKKIRYFV